MTGDISRDNEHHDMVGCFNVDYSVKVRKVKQSLEHHRPPNGFWSLLKTSWTRTGTHASKIASTSAKAPGNLAELFSGYLFSIVDGLGS